MRAEQSLAVARVIVTVRGLRVILSSDLARIYGVEPKVLNQAVNGGLHDAAPDLVDLTNRSIRALRLQPVDVTDLRRADPLLRMLAARDGVPLYERDPGEFGRFASLAARRYADTRKFRVSEREEVRDFITRSTPTPSEPSYDRLSTRASESRDG